MPDFPPLAARLQSVTPTCISISRCLPNKRSNAFRKPNATRPLWDASFRCLVPASWSAAPPKKKPKTTNHYYAVEEADWDAVDRVLELVLGKEGPQGMEAEMAYRLRERFAAGFGGMPFIGDPDHVASELDRIAGWSFDGVIFGFVNYLEELPFFAQEVLPRLERMDLRQPFSEGSK